MPEKLLSNLTMGTSYAIQVKAIANAASIAEGTTTLVMPPLGKPAVVTLTVLSDKRITVNWQPVALCDGYKVAFSPTYTYGSLITETTHTTSIMPTGTYSARVKAILGDIEGEHTPSGSVGVSDTVTPSITMPVIGNTVSAGSTSTTISLEGDLISNGGDSACECGFVWSLSDNPTVNDSKVISAGATTGIFCATVSGLTPNTLYFIKAYAKTSTGLVAYSSQSISVTTKTSSPSVTAPTISVSEISSITDNSATAYVTIVSDGGGATTGAGGKATKKGDTIANMFTAVWVTVGSSFKVDMSSLSPESEYLFEAYLTTSSHTGTASKAFFTIKQGTGTSPSTGILPPTGIYATDATGSSVNLNWTTSVDSVDSYRIYYKPTVESITFAEMKGNLAWYKEVSGLSASLDNLDSDGWYQVRIVSVVNGVEGGFSDMITFKTAIGVGIPVVETVSAGTGKAFNFSVAIKVISDGGAELMDAGALHTFAISSDPVFERKLGNTFGTPFHGLGNKEVTISEVMAGTAYKVRAYARNYAGMTGYGTVKIVTASEVAALPDVKLDNMYGGLYLRDTHPVYSGYWYKEGFTFYSCVGIMIVPLLQENVKIQLQQGKYDGDVSKEISDWYDFMTATLVREIRRTSKIVDGLSEAFCEHADPNTISPENGRQFLWVDTADPAWSLEIRKPTENNKDAYLPLRIRYINTMTGATGEWRNCSSHFGNTSLPQQTKYR